jgi:hypothetical protein
MRNPYSLEKRVDLLILASPITLNRDDIPIELPFNKVLEVMEDLKDIRFIFNQMDPHVFVVVIYEANIICVPLKDRYGEPERGGVNGSR